MSPFELNALKVGAAFLLPEEGQAPLNSVNPEESLIIVLVSDVWGLCMSRKTLRPQWLCDLSLVTQRWLSWSPAFLPLASTASCLLLFR